MDAPFDEAIKRTFDMLAERLSIVEERTERAERAANEFISKHRAIIVGLGHKQNCVQTLTIYESDIKRLAELRGRTPPNPSEGFSNI